MLESAVDKAFWRSSTERERRTVLWSGQLMTNTMLHHLYSIYRRFILKSGGFFLFIQ